MTWSFYRLSLISRITVIATAITLAFVLVFRVQPGWAEAAYGNGLYPLIRSLLDVLYLPAPGIYATLLGVLLMIVYIIYRGSRRHGVRAKIKTWVKGFGCLLCLIFCWFYWIWGFNYARPNLEARMEYTLTAPDTNWLADELYATIKSANDLRALPSLQYLGALSADEIINKPLDIEEINADLENVLPEFFYPIKIKPRLRFLKPDGALLHWSTAGIYWLFTGEPNVDSGVHYLKKPVTASHELAHAHGVTSEGDCNFIAYVACVQSEDELLQYSGHLSYLGYLMRAALKRMGREKLTPFYQAMSAEVRADRQAIHDHHNQYKDIMPQVRDAVYDTYLKSQGVQSGLASYGEFVLIKYARDKKAMK